MRTIETLKHQLLTVSGELLPNIPSRDKPLNIDMKHFCTIQRGEDKRKAILQVDTIIGPTPPALFRINLSFEVRVQWKEEITTEEIVKEAYQLCSGLGNPISHVVSMISFELIDTHIILPPNLNQESFTINKR